MWTKSQLREQIKIIFFDIDGTLIDSQTKEMSPRTKEALLLLKERGIILALATGRLPNNIPPLENVDFDAHLTLNGSYCHSHGNVLHTCAHQPDDVQKIVANAKALGFSLRAAGKDGDVDWQAIPEDLAIFQFMMSPLPENYQDILTGTENARITSWSNFSCDIIPVNSGKAEGIRKTLEYFGLFMENAMAFGDGGNDLDMLKVVGHGVAMGNAKEELKQAADAVCGRIDEDGIYHYLKEMGII